LFYIYFREIAEARTGVSEISLQPLSLFAQHGWILDHDQVLSLLTFIIRAVLAIC
jgi:hypothetical protein